MRYVALRHEKLQELKFEQKRVDVADDNRQVRTGRVAERTRDLD